MTTVINIRDRAALVAARNAGNYIYCGRHSYGVGKLGNKYSVVSGVPGTVRVASREESIQRHRDDVLADPEFCKWIRRKLKNKVLGCFCKPKACHCDTYAAIANGELHE